MAVGIPFYGVPSVSADGKSLLVNGKEYEIIQSPVKVVYQSKAAIGLPSSGTIGNNGALTLSGNQISTTFSSGAWFHFPANAVYSGSPAGFYWTRMSSSTAGVVYSNYTSDITQTRNPPATETPLSGTTGSSYTGFTGDGSNLLDVLRVNFGFALSPGDAISVECAIWFPDNTNGKWLRGYGNNSASYLFIRPWNPGSSTGAGTFAVRQIPITWLGNTVAAQGWGNTDPNFSDAGSATISMSSPSITFQISRSNAADMVVLPFIRIMHYKATQ